MDGPNWQSHPHSSPLQYNSRMTTLQRTQGTRKVIRASKTGNTLTTIFYFYLISVDKQPMLRVHQCSTSPTVTFPCECQSTEHAGYRSGECKTQPQNAGTMKSIKTILPRSCGNKFIQTQCRAAEAAWPSACALRFVGVDQDNPSSSGFSTPSQVNNHGRMSLPVNLSLGNSPNHTLQPSNSMQSPSMPSHTESLVQTPCV